MPIFLFIWIYCWFYLKYGVACPIIIVGELGDVGLIDFGNIFGLIVEENTLSFYLTVDGLG